MLTQITEIKFKFTMDETIVCCGCLCAGRRMVLVDQFQQKLSFLQIISEIPMNLLKEELNLCWECDATLKRITKFKDQVKECFMLLSNYADENVMPIKLKREPRLGTHNAFNIIINPGSSGQEFTYPVTVKSIKTEEGTVIKEEDNVSVYSDFNDTVLDEVTVKRKKKKVTKERKRKKKKEKEVELIREIELTEEELVDERKMLASREEYVNAMFHCEKCIVSFPNADDLADHLNMKHDPSKSDFKCSICECTFTSEVSHNYHASKHRRRYECTACGERMRSKGAATKHYEIMHCVSAEYTSSTDALKENGTSNEKQDPDESGGLVEAVFPCELCHKSFRWKTSLRKHLETHSIESGQKRKPYCEPCRLSFTTTSNLQKHVKTSSKHQIQLKLWKLKESLPDDASTPQKHEAHLEQIRRSVNKARQTHACAQCGKRFQWRGNLARHVTSHAARANGELVCTPCNRTFSSIATYNQHMKISKKHVSENDFKYMCSDCGKRFANKTRLKDHIDWEHLKNFVHTCDVCQKVFKSHTSLYLHKQVVHRKDNVEHLCDHCGKHFPNKAKLRSHIVALHSGTAPYKCAVCCARFSWHSCLSRHARRAHPPAPARGAAGHAT